MKRNHFLLIAGIVACLFGLLMMLVPEQMLGNLTVTSNLSTKLVMQWVGVGLLSIGCINLLAFNDEGSKALRAIMVGNIVLHVVAFGFDIYDYAQAFINITGLVTGAVIHILLIVGFVYYLRALLRQ